MARNFPTYLYYNNYKPGTKSPGKFIVRTVAPRFVAEVVEHDNAFSIEVLEWWDDESRRIPAIKHVHNWYVNNILKRSSSEGIAKTYVAYDDLKKHSG